MLRTYRHYVRQEGNNQEGQGMRRRLKPVHDPILKLHVRGVLDQDTPSERE